MDAPRLRHIPPGLSKDEFLRQIGFALLLRNTARCAECPLLYLTNCLCHGNPAFRGCGDKANELLEDLRAQPPVIAGQPPATMLVQTTKEPSSL